MLGAVLLVDAEVEHLKKKINTFMYSVIMGESKASRASFRAMFLFYLSIGIDMYAIITYVQIDIQRRKLS